MQRVWPFSPSQWGRRDSNPHALRHVILSHARLPVPTLPQKVKYFIQLDDSIIYGFKQDQVYKVQRGPVKKWFMVCAWCKEKVRQIRGCQNEELAWQGIETINQAQLKEASISHGICPTCSANFYTDIDIPLQLKKRKK